MLWQKERCPAAMPASHQTLLESSGGTRSLLVPVLGASPVPSSLLDERTLRGGLQITPKPKLPSSQQAALEAYG